jgi:putative transcriptional regulator
MPTLYTLRVLLAMKIKPRFVLTKPRNVYILFLVNEKHELKGDDTLDPKKIGARLKTLRGNKSQHDLAMELGVQPSAYWMYEHGERIPRDSVKKKIAAYYDKTVDEIFYD